MVFSKSTPSIVSLLLALLPFQSESVCSSWKPRGDPITGSREQTESGLQVAISDDGQVIAVEEYGDSNGPYKQNGKGTGRLRVLEWNGQLYTEQSVFTEGLSFGLTMTGDGNKLSTIGYNTTNDGYTETIDMVVQLYERDGSNWTQVGKTLSKDNGLSYYPTNQYLSRDGTRLTVSGGVDTDSSDMNKWRSIHQIYIADKELRQVGNDIIVDGDIVSTALSANGQTFIVAAWLASKIVQVSVWDYDESVSEWTQRGGTNNTITVPVAEVRIPLFPVRLSNDGNIFALQADERVDESMCSGETPGSIFVFEDVDGEFKLRGPKISGTDAFGFSFGLSGDGNVVAVGGTLSDENERFGGYLHIFQFNGEEYVLQQKLDGDSVYAETSLALSLDGSYIVSGDVWPTNELTGTTQIFECKSPTAPNSPIVSTGESIHQPYHACAAPLELDESGEIQDGMDESGAKAYLSSPCVAFVFFWFVVVFVKNS